MVYCLDTNTEADLSRPKIFPSLCLAVLALRFVTDGPSFSIEDAASKQKKQEGLLTKQYSVIVDTCNCIHKAHLSKKIWKLKALKNTKIEIFIALHDPLTFSSPLVDMVTGGLGWLGEDVGVVL